MILVIPYPTVLDTVIVLDPELTLHYIVYKTPPTFTLQIVKVLEGFI